MAQEKVLILGLVWPEPNSTAAGQRMLQLIHFFIENDYDLTFASTASSTELSEDLGVLGIKVQSVRLNHDSFDAFLRDLQPAMVVFDRFITEEQFGWRVAQQVPNALRILDTEDLHSLRAARQECLLQGTSFTTSKWLQSDKAKREIASIYRCDFSLIISRYELQLLKEIVKIDSDLLLYLPFLFEPPTVEAQRDWTTFEDRADFVCVGNGKHAPNIDGLQWLKNEIWPIIRKALPNAKIKIYGAYMPQHILKLHSPKEGFLVMGWVKDVQSKMGAARVNLAPLRFGAGLKGKLIDAMVSGTPSVTTAVGAEGMHQNQPWCGFIHDNAAEFATAAIKLYQDEKVWLEAKDNGMQILRQCFDKKIHSLSFQQKIKKLRENLETHRNANFIGALLQHQTLAATKYMSRWIALKNQSEA